MMTLKNDHHAYGDRLHANRNPDCVCSPGFYLNILCVSAYTTDFSPRVFSIRSMMPRVMTIIRVARAAMVGSK